MYCINPSCPEPGHPGSSDHCIHCGATLLLKERYQVLRPLVLLTPFAASRIFEVEDTRDQSQKVLKILVYPYPELITLMQRERKALGLLSTSEKTPKVERDAYFTLEITPQVTLHCLVQEKVEGQNLLQWLEAGGILSESQAIDWLRQLTEILKIVHSRRFFHRDINPANIMLRSNGQLILIDFGAVRQITDSYLMRLRRPPGEAEAGLTPITAIGTPGYSPPEQEAGGGGAVPESDFFAMGRTFVHLLTRQVPLRVRRYPGTDRLQWRELAPQVSSPFADFLDHLMAPDWHDRPSTPEEILHLLDELPQKIKRDRLLRSWQFRVMSGAAILAIFVAGGLFISTLIHAQTAKEQREQARRLLEEGRQAQLNDKPAAAREKYEQGLKLDPTGEFAADAYNNLALLCYKDRQYECAINNYNRALKLRPNAPEYLYNLAVLYDQRGDYANAKEYYRRLPRSADAKNNLARVEIINGSYQEAVTIATEALSQTSDRVSLSSIHKNLGWAKFKLKQYDAALNELNQALRLERRGDVYCLLAQVQAAQGDQQGFRLNGRECIERNDITSNLPEVQQWKKELLNQLVQ